MIDRDTGRERIAAIGDPVREGRAAAGALRMKRDGRIIFARIEEPRRRPLRAAESRVRIARLPPTRFQERLSSASRAVGDFVCDRFPLVGRCTQ